MSARLRHAVTAVLMLFAEALLTLCVLLQLQALQLAARLATFIDELRLEKFEIGRAAARRRRRPEWATAAAGSASTSGTRGEGTRQPSLRIARF